MGYGCSIPEIPAVVVYDFDMTCVDTSYVHKLAEDRAIESLKKEKSIDEEDTRTYDEIFKSASEESQKKHIKETLNKEISGIAELYNKKKNGTISNDEERIYRDCLKHIKIYDDLTETWKLLREKGFEIAICTNAHDEYFNILSKMTRLDEYIQKYDVTIVTANKYENGKPHHEPIEKAIDEAAYNAGFDWHKGAKVIKVGDMRRDIESAFNFNCAHKNFNCLGVHFSPKDAEKKDMQDYEYSIESHIELMRNMPDWLREFDKATEYQRQFFKIESQHSKD